MQAMIDELAKQAEESLGPGLFQKKRWQLSGRNI